MKILAGFYTHNRLRHELLTQSLKCFLEAAANGPVIPVVSSWLPIPGLTCRNLISHFRIAEHGHLNILLQLQQIILSCDEPWDYFAFCEHDCLYPPNYFEEISGRLTASPVSGLANENHIGLRPAGFADSCYHTQPLFSMVVRRDHLMVALQKKMAECIRTGWCCLEPDDRDDWMIIRCDDPMPPIVHVNMNSTGSNHHLTDHHNFYSQTEFRTIHPFWGEYRNFGVFTSEEITAATTPALQPGTYQIVAANYGDFTTNRVVSYLEALRRKNFQGVFQVSNADAGTDPAPGTVKSLRLHVVAAHGAPSTLEFKEGTVFRL